LKISEDNELKGQFGKLGMYLIEIAQAEIKKLNQKILFQKAEIKKKHNEDVYMSSLKIKEQFEKYDNEFFNYISSSTFITFNDKFLNLKHQLVEDLRISVVKQLEEKIESNYANYMKYLLDSIEKVSSFMDKPPNMIFTFNSKDFRYFKEKSNLKEIQKYFKNPTEIRESDSDFIGGFKLQTEGILSYNNVIDNLIASNLSLFQIELSKIISDQEINEIKEDFEEFVENKRLGIHLIEDYLKKNE